jgi:hypothetical protein
VGTIAPRILCNPFMVASKSSTTESMAGPNQTSVPASIDRSIDESDADCRAHTSSGSEGSAVLSR